MFLWLLVSTSISVAFSPSSSPLLKPVSSSLQLHSFSTTALQLATLMSMKPLLRLVSLIAFVGFVASAVDGDEDGVDVAPWSWLTPSELAALASSKRVSEFLGKRAPGSEFLGKKRRPGNEFLGRKRASEFLGRRRRASEFLGRKRSRQGDEPRLYRGASPYQGHKRVPGSEFLGKRSSPF